MDNIPTAQSDATTNRFGKTDDSVSWKPMSARGIARDYFHIYRCRREGNYQILTNLSCL